MANDAFIVNSNCSFDFGIYTTLTNFCSKPYYPIHPPPFCLFSVYKCLNCHAFCKSHIIFVHLWPQFIISYCPYIVFLHFGRVVRCCCWWCFFFLSLSSTPSHHLLLRTNRHKFIQFCLCYFHCLSLYWWAIKHVHCSLFFGRVCVSTMTKRRFGRDQ